MYSGCVAELELSRKRDYRLGGWRYSQQKNCPSIRVLKRKQAERSGKRAALDRDATTASAVSVCLSVAISEVRFITAVFRELLTLHNDDSVNSTSLSSLDVFNCMCLSLILPRRHVRVKSERDKRMANFMTFVFFLCQGARGLQFKTSSLHFSFYWCQIISPYFVFRELLFLNGFFFGLFRATATESPW